MNWRDTVERTKSDNPGLPFKVVLRKAGETYRTPQNDSKKTKVVAKKIDKAKTKTADLASSFSY